MKSTGITLYVYMYAYVVFIECTQIVRLNLNENGKHSIIFLPISQKKELRLRLRIFPRKNAKNAFLIVAKNKIFSRLQTSEIFNKLLGITFVA
ncbi:hypothetical protein V1477_017024 [Vespula maculifrons]|uniref:Uncharacterized protein n=1 Tax=Vespula maculifrons TaxID=7453 RepID=A0ABD2B4V6_VESMC